MTQRLALMGATSGPWVSASGVRNPTLHVKGLKHSLVDAVLRLVNGQFIYREVKEDGLHQLYPLPAQLDWIKLSCAERGVVCNLISGRAIDPGE